MAQCDVSKEQRLAEIYHAWRTPLARRPSASQGLLPGDLLPRHPSAAAGPASHLRGPAAACGAAGLHSGAMAHDGAEPGGVARGVVIYTLDDEHECHYI